MEPERIVGKSDKNGGNRPGDIFNQRGSWDEVPLEAKGWKIVSVKNGVSYLRRPGKEQGISATLNYGGSDVFYNFSSNGCPFEAGTPYSKFGALTYLAYDGDFAAAASHLAKQGYGEQFTTEHPYHAVPSGLYYTKSTKDGPMSVFLTNFTARIVADVTEDDGVETRHSYEIEAKLKGRSFRFTVPSAQFGGLRWVAENLGAQAIVFPYVGRERTPVAIQFLSENGMLQKTVYTHTGWRKVSNRWVYLHEGGGLGQDGPVGGIEVKLEGGLSRYRLAEPEGDSVASVQASLRLLDVAPDRIMIPIFCSIWRAIVGISVRKSTNS